MAKTLSFFAASLALFASALAAPAPAASSNMLYIVTLPTATYTFPNLAPAGRVDMAAYSTVSAQVRIKDLPTILKAREAEADADDDEDASSLPVFTHGDVTFTFPNLAPAGTVNMAVYSTGSAQAAVTDLPTILKAREADADADAS
ncbi:uncharacterized protein LTR77_001985 [Saxophila tyrrhenica]|uniref:Uncharacterized protein n=1 Tax=Saxophila tyrrhenica TaxID=1690608 RepID=A0AAV9PI82_9PEZI|nr:hypothetical protein LTR77_001985 [Saxophila tyrrhenica]